MQDWWNKKISPSYYVVYDASYATQSEASGRSTMEMDLAVSWIVMGSGYLWLALAAVWMGSAPFVKRTVYEQTERSRYVHLGVMALGMYLLFGWTSTVEWLERPLYRMTVALSLEGLVLVLAGLGFAVWARLMLGENWSGRATLKEGHTLVRRGPYSLVRHPIYTGLLLALLGTAMERGLVRSFLAFPVCCLGLWLKVRVEERLMMERFGAEYARYRREVPALAPFLF